MSARPSRRRGFTLVELMVVIIIIGVLAGLAMWGAGRPRAETQLDSAVTSFRGALNGARQRAVTTHASFLVELSTTSGFRYCRAKTDLSGCLDTAPDGGTAEEVPWVRPGDDVVLAKYAKATNVSGETGAVTFSGSTVRLVARPSGVVDGDPATTADEGFTLYLRTLDGAKVRKIWLFPLTGQNHVADAW